MGCTVTILLLRHELKNIAMKKRATVDKIMTEHPHTVNLTNSVRDVANLFRENNYHHLPVVSGDKLIGIISKTDIERISFFSGKTEEHANTTIYDVVSIDEIMTKNVEAVQKTDTIRSAAEILSSGSIHALPVLEDEKVCGIITTTDVIKFVLDLYK